MDKKDAIWVAVVSVFSGFIVGITLGVVLMVPKTYIGRDTVVECRRMMDAVYDLSHDEQARFWRITVGNPALEEDWRVRKAIADIEISENRP